MHPPLLHKRLPSVSALSAPHIRRFLVHNFRSYASATLDLDQSFVILTGDNGAGKTNLLEALSLFMQGRGFRRAELSSMIHAPRPHMGFGLSLEIEDALAPLGCTQLGFGLEPAPEQARKIKMNGQTLSSLQTFSDVLRVVWFIPQMSGLLTGPPSDRRRFLDRLVLTLDSEHGARVSALEKALRNRNKILEINGPGASPWLQAAERELAELAIAVAAARHETWQHLNALLAKSQAWMHHFPWARTQIIGVLEEKIAHHPAIEVEEYYLRLLHENRTLDAARGRTTQGPHTSDLQVWHGPKNIEAAQASTGEQKALIIGLILAQTQLVTQITNIAPLVLLDDIAAHLDPARRACLWSILAQSPAQVWMSGTHSEDFSDFLAPNSQFFHVAQGDVQAYKR